MLHACLPVALQGVGVRSRHISPSGDVIVHCKYVVPKHMSYNSLLISSQRGAMFAFLRARGAYICWAVPETALLQVCW